MVEEERGEPEGSEESGGNPAFAGGGLAIGLAIGVALGVAMDSLGMGIGIGLAIGIAFGAAGQKFG